ncbi:VOC family protein [Litorivivens sp.]|uniref:VOC family protein n=1 Tax=Litorivivens sp. TaxID=2020868 RepID=UPI0035658AF2
MQENNRARAALKDFITGLRHVGHIVDDLQGSIAEFRRIYGLEDSDITVLPPFGEEAPARFGLLQVGSVEFELIEPISDEMRATLHSVKSGAGGINHVAYVVSDIDAAMQVLADQGIRPGHVTPNGVVDTGRTRIAYLNPADTGDLLIELVEVYG